MDVHDDEKKRARQQVADEKKRAEEELINIIPKICQTSPWRLLQFGTKPTTSATTNSASASAKSPVMDKSKRKAFRGICKNVCQLTGEKRPDLLKIAHIVPKHTAEQSFAEWKIRCKINSDKNLLLILVALEASFDRGDFCLLMKIMPGTTEEALAVKILNASILEDTIPGIPGCELKFKDLEGRFLDICLDISSHQLIAKHSFFTLAAAASKGWIPLPEYLDLATKIKDHSPEQDKIDRVKEWIRANSQGLPPLARNAVHTVRRT